MWIIASIPFWIIGTVAFVGALGSIKWKQPTSDAEVWRVLSGLVLAGVFFLIAAKVAG